MGQRIPQSQSATPMKSFTRRVQQRSESARFSPDRRPVADQTDRGDGLPDEDATMLGWRRDGVEAAPAPPRCQKLNFMLNSSCLASTPPSRPVFVRPLTCPK